MIIGALFSEKLLSIHEEFTKIEGDLGETEFRAIYIDKTYERLEFLKKIIPGNQYLNMTP